MISPRHAALVGAALLCATCAGEPAPSPSLAGPMPSDVVARVGGVDIAASSVARVAAAQSLSPVRARDVVVSDGLFARGARARDLDAVPSVRAQLDAVLARAVLRRLLEDAERAGPVTDDELRVATDRHWLELDRPEGFRTVHAVVRVKEGADGSLRERARSLAASIAAAVAPARDVALSTSPPAQVAGQPPPADPAAEAFQKAARAAPADGLEVVAEVLPPVTAAGRVFVPGRQELDADFARAAGALAARGDVSPPVTSAFGVHVVMLLERIPAQVVSEDERRRLVREEVVTDRARASERRLMAALRRDTALAEGSGALLELVRIEP